MSVYSAEQIRGCRCSSRPQVILSVGECKIANALTHAGLVPIHRILGNHYRLTKPQPPGWCYRKL
jgi:hypothetical protein